MTTTMTSATEAGAETGFDFAARVDELRTHPTEVLRAGVVEARREQQRWRLEELAATRVLDDRGALERMPDRSESARTQRSKKEVARALESRPALARAFHDGAVSADQLEPLCELSTSETDAEWAARGPTLAPVDLHRRVRQGQTVTAEDAQRRHEARELRTWRDKVDGMHCGRWRLPEVDGVLVEKVFEVMAERRRPAAGEAWDTLAHRKADALVDLVTNYADVERSGRPIIEVVEISDPRQTPGASVDGTPIAAETLSAIKLNAKIRRCEVDDTGCARTVDRKRSPLPRDVERHVRRRDLTCRVPGCEASRNLQIHHTDPICDFGDTHLVHKLAAVCPAHHRLLIPHGPWRLTGDAQHPDGLTLEHATRTRDGPAP
jgi:hypothetical protein